MGIVRALAGAIVGMYAAVSPAQASNIVYQTPTQYLGNSSQIGQQIVAGKPDITALLGPHALIDSAHTGVSPSALPRYALDFVPHQAKKWPGMMAVITCVKGEHTRVDLVPDTLVEIFDQHIYPVTVNYMPQHKKHCVERTDVQLGKIGDYNLGHIDVAIQPRILENAKYNFTLEPTSLHGHTLPKSVLRSLYYHDVWVRSGRRARGEEYEKFVKTEPVHDGTASDDSGTPFFGTDLGKDFRNALIATKRVSETSIDSSSSDRAPRPQPVRTDFSDYDEHHNVLAAVQHSEMNDLTPAMLDMFIEAGLVNLDDRSPDKPLPTFDWTAYYRTLNGSIPDGALAAQTEGRDKDVPYVDRIQQVHLGTLPPSTVEVRTQTSYPDHDAEHFPYAKGLGPEDVVVHPRVVAAPIRRVVSQELAAPPEPLPELGSPVVEEALPSLDSVLQTKPEATQPIETQPEKQTPTYSGQIEKVIEPQDPEMQAKAPPAERALEATVNFDIPEGVPVQSFTFRPEGYVITFCQGHVIDPDSTPFILGSLEDKAVLATHNKKASKNPYIGLDTGPTTELSTLGRSGVPVLDDHSALEDLRFFELEVSGHNDCYAESTAFKFKDGSRKPLSKQDWEILTSEL